MADDTLREQIDELLRRMEAGTDASDVAAGLRALPLRELDLSSVLRLSRALESVEWKQEPVRLAYLSNVTVSELLPHAALWAAREGVRLDQWVAPVGQQVQQVTDPNSPLREFDPDAVVVFLEPRLLRSEAFNRFAALSPEDRKGLSDDIVDELGRVADGVVQNIGATAIVANAAPPPRPGAGVADTKLPFGETEFFGQLNLELLRRLREEPGAQLLDLQRCLASAGRAGRDPRRFYLAKMAWTGPAVQEIAEEVTRHLLAATGRTKKCLVVDLDNTLWGGVVGEDGVQGIRVGPGDPVGEAYTDVQRTLLEINRRGILLAVSSKNNEADVREAFERRDMLLDLEEDFAALEIHWRPKHQSLMEIAESLNIGLDSLVFIDDDPAEIALVNEAVPEVETLLLSGDPATFPDLIRGLLSFEKSVILDADLGKTAQYHQQKSRAKHREGVGDLEDYLSSLETRVRIRHPEEEDLARLHQLFTKTNQFNLTTRRYSLPELRAMIADPDTDVVIWDVGDRFGNLGTVGAYITRRIGDTAEVDSFLMSCRAMGRGVETAVMNHLKKEAMRASSTNEILGTYVETPKNAPVASFFDEQGFERLDGESEGAVRYRLARESVTPVPCGWIDVEEATTAA